MAGRKKEWVLHVEEIPLTVGTDAYTAGDVVGGRLSLAVPASFGSCYIAWARLVDDHDQTEPFDLWCFYAQPSSIADDAAFAPTEDDKLKHFTTLEFAAGNYDQTGAESSVKATGKDKALGEYLMAPLPVDGNLYFYLVAGDTPDYADADDLTLHVALMVQ